MSAYRGHCAAAPGRDAVPAATPDTPTNPRPFVCNVLTIVTAAAIMPVTGIGSLADTLWFGLGIDTGNLLAMCLTIAINPNSPRPFSYAMENAPGLLTGTVKTSDDLFPLGKAGARHQPICEESRSGPDADARDGWRRTHLR